MEKEFVPYEQALALKEFLFDEPCFGYYIYDELIIEGRYKNSDHGFFISGLVKYAKHCALKSTFSISGFIGSSFGFENNSSGFNSPKFIFFKKS